MRRLMLSISAVLIPAEAFAFGWHRGPTIGSSLLIAVMAAAAIAGYRVIKQGAQDKGQAKYAGRAVGWVLIITGLLGFLCASMSVHKRSGGKTGCRFCAYKHGGGKWKKSCHSKGQPPQQTQAN